MSKKSSAATGGNEAWKNTIRRLEKLPLLREKLVDDKALLAELQGNKQIQREYVERLKVEIAKTTSEISQMERALRRIANDPYYVTVTGKYFEQMTDAAIADQIHCDTTTVWRNRNRLLCRLTILIYGAEAVS